MWHLFCACYTEKQAPRTKSALVRQIWKGLTCAQNHLALCWKLKGALPAGLHIVLALGKLYGVLNESLGNVGTGYGPRCCWQPALQQPQQSRPWHGQDGVPVSWLR